MGIRTLAEQLKIVRMHATKTLVTTGATFGQHIDTQGFGSAVIQLNVGAFSAPATLSAILYEQETNNGDLTLVPVTLGNLGLITGNDAPQSFIGGIETKNYKRYLALRLEGSQSRTANPTIGVSASIILGKAIKEPADPGTAVFNLVDDGINRA
jgi:hypothetical protein